MAGHKGVQEEGGTIVHRRPIKGSQGSFGMLADRPIISPSVEHVGLIGTQIRNKPLAILLPLISVDPRLVPVVDLGADDDPGDDDQEVDRDREPIVRGDMFADAADDQASAPFHRFEVQPQLARQAAEAVETAHLLVDVRDMASEVLGEVGFV
jgi:hypothetical protein